jgi:hypothetical protein
MFFVSFSCFVFVFISRVSFLFQDKDETQNMKTHNGGGWGQCSSAFLLVLSYINTTTTTRGSTTNAQECVKEQQARGGAEVVFIAHLKGTKMKINDGGANGPCHSSLHNIRM